MAKLIVAAIAITLIVSGTAHADHGDHPIGLGLGVGTVATATPTGLVAGTVATATPTDTPSVTPTPSETPTNSPEPNMRTLVPLISEDGCTIPMHRHRTAWWLIALPMGIAPFRRWRVRLVARRHE
jgi:hypothetical protein